MDTGAHGRGEGPTAGRGSSGTNFWVLKRIRKYVHEAKKKKKKFEGEEDSSSDDVGTVIT